MGRAAGDRALTRRTALGLMAAAAVGAGSRPAGAQPLAERPIPATGEALPVIGVGTWRVFDVGDSPAERAPLREVLRHLVARGGRVVDSSPMYGAAESVVGELAAELGVTDRLFLATKVWTTGREAGLRQMEESRRRLRAARLDLLQVHNLVDWRTHLRTLAAWKESGRVREWAAEIGCESWAQLFLKWILGHPAITCVIPGPGRPEHLLDNLKAGTGEFPDERLRARIAAAVAAA